MSITVGGLTFRWSDDQLIVTTPKGQDSLNASETAQLLDFLYAKKDEIFDAEAHDEGLASWARLHQQPRFVIGSLNPQQEQGTPAPLSLEEGRVRRRRNEETDAE